MEYTELQVTTNFSFKRGASHPHELVEQAASFGYSRIGITDRNTFAGLVRAHTAAKLHGMSVVLGASLDLLDGPGLLAYPTDRDAYCRLSALLTTGNLRAEKGECHLYRQDVYKHSKGLKFVVVPPVTLNNLFDFDGSFKSALGEYKEALGNHLYLAATKYYIGNDAKRIYQLSQMGVPMVATNDVHYHTPERRQLQDVLTCVREKCTITNAGYRLHQNAERHLKSADEMRRLFRQYPDAIRRTQEIAEACIFSLDKLKYVYPTEINANGRTPMEELIFLTWQGANERFNGSIPTEIKKTVQNELDFIGKMEDGANYFLTVYDYVHVAREMGILCQGRGSAANSAVCYCLGITSVDPSKFKLLFARFMSEGRNEPPDIDVDFEHERREEIIQYIYEKYGRDRAAIVATVTTQHQKGAIRDVGKVMGLSKDAIDKLSGTVSELDEFDNYQLQKPESALTDPMVAKVLDLTRQMIGFPRQLGQHTGGFVMTNGKLTDLCPIINARMEQRTNIEWDKNDVDALGFLKVDVLGLGILTCIRKSFELVKKHYGLDLTMANIPQDDPKVYEMISIADTIGDFQIESRAQMSMLPRMKPNCFYDLVIQVAIIRPGPIQGHMVHPYLRRRNGEEAVTYPSKDVEYILGRTLGIPIFQEQAMEIAIVAAGYTPAEADLLRRSISAFKENGKQHLERERFISGMLKNGYDLEFADYIFDLISNYKGYGFPESHSISFALLAYITAWLKCYYPEVYACALLNSQPMGFYQPAQIIIDTRKYGVVVREIDINYSTWDNLLEEKCGEYHAIRLGFRQIKGIREDDIRRLMDSRTNHYRSITQLSDAGLSQAALELLADADAFRSIGLDRRQALWEISALYDKPVALFQGQPSENEIETQVELPLMRLSEHVVHDYAATGLSIKAHFVGFVRETLDRLHNLTIKEINDGKDGAKVKVAGSIFVRQRPGTAKGVCFITIEDETGFCNLVVFPNIFDKYRRVISQAALLMVDGKLQVEDGVVHVIVHKCYDLSNLFGTLTDQPKTGPIMRPSRADNKTGVFIDERVDAKPIQKSRDFK